jgi:hypothetical protein
MCFAGIYRYPANASSFVLVDPSPRPIAEAAWICAFAAGLLACRAADSTRSGALDAASGEAASGFDAAPWVDAAPDDGAVAIPALNPDAAALCTRHAADAVHDVFCAWPAVAVRSLTDIESRLGLGTGMPEGGTSYDAAASGPFALSTGTLTALLGHSTALFGSLVSPINPRTFLLAQSAVIAFHRGVQDVEVATLDRDTNRFNLYLFTFEQACNASPGGCSPGDLFTPRIESNWTQVQIRDTEDLKNTPLDCRQCHERGRDTPILLMRELQAPWTHFLEPDIGVPGYPEATGADLFSDYLAAKGDETYAGIPANVLRDTIGIALESLVPKPQPLVFDGQTILSERWPTLPDGGYPIAPQRSATWYAAYDAFKRGEQLALPYFDPRPTDPTKQAALTDAYRRYRLGLIRAEDLPDLSDIFPDDAQVRAEIGLQTEPGATPAQTLVQACGSCHNDVLDQSISRARFNIALSRMDRAEFDLAIGRAQASRDSGSAMPPLVSRQPDPGALGALIDYLKQDVRSAEDDAMLERAARLGLVGGASTSP